MAGEALSIAKNLTEGKDFPIVKPNDVPQLQEKLRTPAVRTEFLKYYNEVFKNSPAAQKMTPADLTLLRSVINGSATLAGNVRLLNVFALSYATDHGGQRGTMGNDRNALNPDLNR